MPQVVNIRTLNNGWERNSQYAYIGRPKRMRGGGHFGNPFTHLPLNQTLASVVVASREEAVKAYRDWLDGTAWQNVEPERRKWVLEHITDLKGKDLVCWCAPLACHGDVLVELANQ